jgi:hypothetical protein
MSRESLASRELQPHKRWLLSFVREASGSYPDECGAVPRGATNLKRTNSNSMDAPCHGGNKIGAAPDRTRHFPFQSKRHAKRLAVIY